MHAALNVKNQSGLIMWICGESKKKSPKMDLEPYYTILYQIAEVLNAL